MRRLVGAIALAVLAIPVPAAALLNDVLAVAAGAQHACAVTTGGAAKCWGANSSGQLGDATTTDRLGAASVSGLGSGVAAIAAGAGHTCALTVAGAVKCWGRNDSGQLGDNTTVAKSAPVAVFGLTSGVLAIAAGNGHTCAVTAGGGVKCWGSNADGQLGDGTATPRLAPVDVATLAVGATAVVAGERHTCALVSGGVKCWGGNDDGAVGDGTTIARAVPVAVSGLAAGVTALAAGNRHSCAIAGGAATCWGYNFAGQLGNGNAVSQSAPVAVSGVASGATAIGAGYLHTCAITAGSAVQCWGGNESGELGDGTTVARLTAAGVSGLAAGATALAAGDFHNCAVVANGVRCWGSNDRGQLGEGVSGARRLTVVGVTGSAAGALGISAADAHSCAVGAGGGAKCWGANFGGVLLGDGTSTAHHVPVDVSGFAAGVSALRAGSQHSCALAGGAVKCWGANTYGQVGDGSTTDRATAVDVSGLGAGGLAVATGLAHSCAVLAGGAVRCWGNNAHGELGNGDAVPQSVPVNVSGLASGVAAVAAGYGHTCALTGAGGVKCWGDNRHGQLGDGSTTQRLAPVDVTGLMTGVTAIAAGAAHTCAVTGGGVVCWGNDDSGQLGDNGTEARSAPVSSAGLPGGVTAIAAGDAHTCAIAGGGALACWGANDAGQLGDGTTMQRGTAAGVPGLATGVTVVSAGKRHTCAATGTGLYCWGDNLVGQVGDGTAGYRAVPVAVTVVGPPPVHTGAVSRKTHGAAGVFELPLASTPANPTTEPRAADGLGAHTVVFMFDKVVTAANAAVVAGTGTPGTPIASGNEIRITVTGAPNAQYLTLALTDVTAADGGTGGAASVRIGFLLGDVDGSRNVTGSDLLIVNAALSQLVGAANFRSDVNLSGTLSLTDMLIVNANQTQLLPAP